MVLLLRPESGLVQIESIRNHPCVLVVRIVVFWVVREYRRKRSPWLLCVTCGGNNLSDGNDRGMLRSPTGSLVR